MKVSIDALCASAGMTSRTYANLKAGRSGGRPSTLAKLQTALRRFQTKFGGEAGEIAPHAAYKVCVVLAAFHLSTDAKLALAADPSRRATANAEWMQAAHARRLGLWIANQWFGFKQVDLARAAGMTRQAVSDALREIEWERDADGALDRIMNQIEEVFS